MVVRAYWLLTSAAARCLVRVLVLIEIHLALCHHRLLHLLLVRLLVDLVDRLGRAPVATRHPAVVAQVDDVTQHEAHARHRLLLSDDLLDAREVLIHAHL